MAEPTLGEITGIQGNAALGDAGTGVTDNIIPQNSQELGYLSALMDAKQKAADFIAQQHQQNLQNTLNNFNNIDTSKILPNDYKEITGDYADLTHDLYNNMDIVQNPMKNPELFSQLMQRESELRGKIAQSQSHNVAYTENQKLMDTTPEFNTQQNIQGQKNFLSTPLSQRQIYQVQSPKIINLAALSKSISDGVTKQIASSTVGNKYISNTTTNSVDPEQWRTVRNATLMGSNGVGGTWNDATLDAYNQLTPQVKQSETYDQFLDNLIPVPKSYVSSASTSANPYGLQSLSEANQIRLAGLNHTYTEEEQNNAEANAEKLAKIRGEIKVENDPSKQGQLVNTLTASLFDSSNDADKSLSYVANGQTQHMNVLNIPEDQRSLFGYQAYDPLGKKITITPDVLTRTPDGHIKAIFYMKNASGKLTNSNGVEKSDQDGSGYGTIDKAHTQDFTPDNVRNILFNEIPANQREKAQTAAISGAPSLNNPVVLKQYLQNKQTPADNTPTSVTVKTETPNFMLPKQINSQTDYDALKSGDQYIAPDGKVYIKK